MSGTPHPTPAGYHWRCNSCEWRGSDLMAAKTHLLENTPPAVPWTHGPFECRADAQVDVRSKVATRVMEEHPTEADRVVILTAESARRRFNAVTTPLIESLRARRGRLRATVEG